MRHGGDVKSLLPRLSSRPQIWYPAVASKPTAERNVTRPERRSVRVHPGGIGEELSLLVELRKWENLEIDLAAAIFESGDAYGKSAGEHAKSIFVKLGYEF